MKNPVKRRTLVEGFSVLKIVVLDRRVYDCQVYLFRKTNNKIIPKVNSNKQVVGPIGPKFDPIGPKLAPIGPKFDPIGPKLAPIGPNQLPLDQELTQSAISSGIARLNFIPVAPFTPSPYGDVISEGKELILGHWLEKKNQEKKYPNFYKQVTVKIADTLRKYNHLDNGGWYCGGGYNPLTTREQDWGCLKPNTPRLSGEYVQVEGKWTKVSDAKKKIIKYESPYGQDLGLFLLKLTYREALAIASKHNKLKSFKSFFGEDYHLDDECERFWEWVKANPSLPICPTEGAKKAASLLSNGYCAIGAPGIWGFYRTKASNGEKVEPYIHPLLTPLIKKGRNFLICFDSDDPQIKPDTVRDVNIAARKTANLLGKSKKVKTYIVRWHHELGKGVDDVIRDHGVEALEQAFFHKVNNLTDWWLNTKKLSDVTVTINERYITSKLPTPDKYSIIQIRSNQGTGKTYATAIHIGQFDPRDYFILGITHRQSLARELAAALGIDYRTDKDKSDIGLMLCADSLRNKPGINIDELVNSPRKLILVLDEVMQVINHILKGQTEIRRYRQEIISNLIKLIHKALDGGQIIGSDADLSDQALGFLAELIGCQRKYLLPMTYTIDNIYGGSGFNAYIMPSDAAWWSQIRSSLKNNQRILIYDGSQQRKSRLSTQHIYNKLKSLLPDKKGLVIDSETLILKSSDINQIKGNWKEELEKYDYIISSPCLETGVSIPADVKIDKVFGYSRGNVHPQNFSQGLVRYRGLCDRYLFINHIGIVGSKEFTRTQVKASLDKKNKYDQSLLFSEPQDQEYLGDFQAIETDLNDILRNQFCIFSACNNLAYANYKENILTLLKQRGHKVFTDVVDLGNVQKNLLNQEFKDDKMVLVKEETQFITNAPDLTNTQYEQLSKQESLSTDEYYALKKHKEKNKWGEQNLSFELVESEILNNLYPKLRLWYFLNNQQKAKSADLSDIKEQKHKTTYERSQSLSYTKVKAMEALRVLELIEELKALTDNRSTWIDNHSECLQQFIRRWQLYSDDVWAVLRVKLPQNALDNPIQPINNLLSKVGFKIFVETRLSHMRKYALQSFASEEMCEGIFSYWDKKSQLKVAC